MTTKQRRAPGRLDRHAVSFIVLLGLVSLFADMAYEGGRSATGPFLSTFGASGALIGLTAGLGELAGFLLRLGSGLWADRSRRYWTFVIVGFVINLGAVPLLALAGNWQTAALLIVAERAGKALRNPSKEALLSHATQTTGHGWGFGLHHALDQTGAVLGPLIFAAILAWRGNYATAFVSLAIPACLSMAVLLTAWRLFPDPGRLSLRAAALAPAGLRRDYWRLVAAAALAGMATVDFALIAYHLDVTRTLPADGAVALYALAMGAQGIASPISGRLFDRWGTPVLACALAAAGLAPLLVFGGGAGVFAGTCLWGIGMGARETIMPAAIAGLSRPERRAAAFGTYYACFGLAWFAGSAGLGLIYDRSPMLVAALALAGHLAGAAVLALAGRPSGQGRLARGTDRVADTRPAST